MVHNNPARWFRILALIMLLAGLQFGVIAAHSYLYPGFIQKYLGFISLRPFHVSYVMFWIFLGCTTCVYCAISIKNPGSFYPGFWKVQWLAWVIAILGITWSYLSGRFGGREYWEFEPVWALPVAFAWLLFLLQYFRSFPRTGRWPVYQWMWMTGILFFLFTFTENYLWVFPWFRQHAVLDMTVQWKANGSMVGAFNQIIYGTALYLMERISKDSWTGYNRLAWWMYFLGLFNLMFNWGHHIYTLPTAPYIRIIGYAVSMTEWIILLKIIFSWKKNLTEAQKHFHYFPYRFLLAADIWVMINLFQALLMSIPAINLYTHGTHVTVAHAMGTTIGINTMILMAALFEFGGIHRINNARPKFIYGCFWFTQFSLLVFWLSLLIAGLIKGAWQIDPGIKTFAQMMEGLRPVFRLFANSGVLLMAGLTVFALLALKPSWFGVTRTEPEMTENT